MNSKYKTLRSYNLVFAPSCALMIYKPELAEKIHQWLEKNLGRMEILPTCCKTKPDVPLNTKIINVCPGCDKRFSNKYENVTTVSLWEVIDNIESFKFPKHDGMSVSIIDACPTRNKPAILDSIRSLLSKMNIRLVEPERTRSNSTCCGSGFYGEMPVDDVIQAMKERTDEMPEKKVAVYCVSCIKSVFIGGKEACYLPDLLFGEETLPQVTDPDEWYGILDKYIEEHS
jgi:hypothetical protein